MKSSPVFNGAKVIVSYISPDMIHAEFSDSVNDLIVHSMAAGLEVARNRVRSTLLEIGRGVQAWNALQQPGATHILFLDSDMRFPPDTLLRLLAWRENIVGCTYSQRHSPRGPTHRDLSDGVGVPVIPHGYTTPVKFEVQSLGLGCVLIHLNVFRRVPRPWFKIEYDGGVMPDGSDKHTSEDNAFFARARAAKERVYCDWLLSREIKHVGTYGFGLEHVEIMMPALQKPA